jgi:hypothetical protein
MQTLDSASVTFTRSCGSLLLMESLIPKSVEANPAVESQFDDI